MDQYMLEGFFNEFEKISKLAKTASLGPAASFALAASAETAIGAGIGAGIGALSTPKDRKAGMKRGALVGGGAALAGNLTGNALRYGLGLRDNVVNAGVFGSAIGAGIGVHQMIKNKFKSKTKKANLAGAALART